MLIFSWHTYMYRVETRDVGMCELRMKYTYIRHLYTNMRVQCAHDSNTYVGRSSFTHRRRRDFMLGTQRKRIHAQAFPLNVRTRIDEPNVT